MWLIDTETQRLAPNQFYEPNIPPYAILSHTWEDEEVTFTQFCGPPDQYLSRKGWTKIQHTCRLALQIGLQYAWVDTCCIDKSSSAELSEAINSMYRWYQESAHCFAYLSDLPAATASGGNLDNPAILSACRWMHRGWTLQELIAPRQVVFYKQDWRTIGSKLDLKATLKVVTGIPTGILDHSETPGQYSVAQRMSWASGRVTTRLEDAAYSLLGLFDVNMPLLYGEGSKAFVRLQEHIMTRSNDVTILAGLTQTPTRHYRTSTSLASSPSAFAGLGNLRPKLHLAIYYSVCALTAAGLHLKMNVHMHDTYDERATLLVDNRHDGVPSDSQWRPELLPYYVCRIGWLDAADPLRGNQACYLVLTMVSPNLFVPGGMITSPTALDTAYRRIPSLKCTERNGFYVPIGEVANTLVSSTNTVDRFIAVNIPPPFEIEEAIPSGHWNSLMSSFYPIHGLSFCALFMSAYYGDEDLDLAVIVLHPLVAAERPWVGRSIVFRRKDHPQVCDRLLSMKFDHNIDTSIWPRQFPSLAACRDSLEIVLEHADAGMPDRLVVTTGVTEATSEWNSDELEVVLTLSPVRG